MNVFRRPRASALLRIFAGTCALFWLVGIVVCGMGGVCSCTDHARAYGVCISPVLEHGAVTPHPQRHSSDPERSLNAEVCQDATASGHHDGTAPQDCSGQNGCKCGCSTIQASTMTMTPIVIPKPVSQPVLNASLLWAAREHVFAALPSNTLRRVKPRDWVFTPVVCLGPAFHSLAPPNSV